MDEHESQPYVRLRFSDPRGDFYLELGPGRELQQRLSAIGPLSLAIEAASKAKTPYVIRPEDEPVLLEALQAPPPLEHDVLVRLRDALRATPGDTR